MTDLTVHTYTAADTNANLLETADAAALAVQEAA
jgi:hypothetical protein